MSEAKPPEVDQSAKARLEGEKKNSYNKLEKLVASYPSDTPNEFVLFGYREFKVTFGDMKTLFGA